MHVALSTAKQEAVEARATANLASTAVQGIEQVLSPLAGKAF